MQNYIDIEQKKQKALLRLVKKYGIILVTTIIGIVFTIFDAFDVFDILIKIKIFDGVHPFIGLVFASPVFLIFTYLLVNSSWEIFYFFKKDYDLFFCLIKDEFELKLDYVDSMRSNNANISVGKDKKVVLKRCKIYFKNVDKTYNDSF